MENKNEPAYPHSDYSPHGLSKLELFAAMAMQGMLSHGTLDWSADPKILATKSIACANELLNQLTTQAK